MQKVRNEMTREEAIAELNTFKIGAKSEPGEKALDMAIKALEKEPCEDCISRQDAQERQRVAQKRRYTFGNDEFSLEAAYHDCKLVFDGITDDDSFQEADTGLILYYANEIIYALHEALKGKDTNVHSNDLISRQAAIDAIQGRK